MNYIQSISRVKQTVTMFDEPDHLHTSNIFECFQQEKISSSFLSNTPKSPATPKLHRKRTKASIYDSEDRNIKTKENQLKNANQNFGHWTLEENKRYHWFMEIHNGHFLNKHMRRMDKIFKSMALFVDSRQAEQCRSHHQKMQKKFHHSISQILLHLREQHYGSTSTECLEGDIVRNGIDLGSGLLSEQFLLQNLRGERQQSSNLQGRQALKQHSLEEFKEFNVDEGGRYNLSEEKELQQQEYSIDQSKNLIDSLFDVEAPHNNFQMI